MSTADHEEQKRDLKNAALDYHEKPTPGKISVTPTKQLVNQRDLALAYTPGVAAACEAIHADPSAAFRYTARGNLVGVVTNGTAVLGLGAIGPLAAKPVMEGKAVLFKKFAGIDVFDIEVNELDPDKLIEIIAALEPTFGGINLEDIKAPECFYIERKLRERMKIPVFHDDQHGTAIIVGAAVINGLSVVGKDIKKVKLVTSGAGAAALACLQLLVELGLPRENIWVTDIEGVVYQGRKVLMDEDKARFAQATQLRKLSEVIEGADIFLGLSAAGVLKPEMVKKMAARPLILALANPTPEIMPEQVKAVRDDAIIATGRSDYANQVNNVLCFPFIFRGALDVGATSITTAMETAAVRALAGLAREEQSDIVASAYGVADVSFGPEYLIPKPFDPRLITRIAPAVAQAAMASGVATRPIDDIQAYRDQLQQFVYHSGTFMKPIFAIAKNAHAGGGKSRIVFAEGEEERVLRAVQVVIDEKLARPILIGRPAVIAKRLERFGSAHASRGGLRFDQSRVRQALSRLLGNVSPTRCAQRRHAAVRKNRNAPPADFDRRDDDAQGRGRRHALRHFRHARTASDVYRSGARSPRRCQRLRGDEHFDGAGAAIGAGRHDGQPRSDRGADRRNHRAGRRAAEASRHRAACCFGFAFQLRLQRCAVGGEDARTRWRWFVSWRRISKSMAKCTPTARSMMRFANRSCRFHIDGRRQFAGVSDARCSQHLVQPVEGDCRKQHCDRPDAARCRQAGEHSDAGGDGTAHRQHDGANGGGSEFGAAARAALAKAPEQSELPAARQAWK